MRTRLDEMLEKGAEFLRKNERNFIEFCQRMGDMVLRAISKFVAVLITIFVIWYEFPELSEHPLFLYLLMMWWLYGVMIFWLDYRQAKAKTTNEKLDELMTKMDEFIGEIRRQNNGS